MAFRYKTSTRYRKMYKIHTHYIMVLAGREIIADRHLEQEQEVDGPMMVGMAVLVSLKKTLQEMI